MQYVMLKEGCQGILLSCHEYTWVDEEVSLVYIYEMVD